MSVEHLFQDRKIKTDLLICKRQRVIARVEICSKPLSENESSTLSSGKGSYLVAVDCDSSSGSFACLRGASVRFRSPGFSVVITCSSVWRFFLPKILQIIKIYT